MRESARAPTSPTRTRSKKARESTIKIALKKILFRRGSTPLPDCDSLFLVPFSRATLLSVENEILKTPNIEWPLWVKITCAPIFAVLVNSYLGKRRNSISSTTRVVFQRSYQCESIEIARSRQKSSKGDACRQENGVHIIEEEGSFFYEIVRSKPRRKGTHGHWNEERLNGPQT